MSHNSKNSYNMPLYPSATREEESTPDKNTQMDYNINETKTYNSSCSAPPTPQNNKNETQSYSNINSTQTPVSSEKPIPFLLIFIINFFFILMPLSDLIMQIKYEFINYYNLCDDIIMFIISIFNIIFVIVKNKKIIKCTSFLSILEVVLGFILKGIGFSIVTKQISSDMIQLAYILVNFFIVFIRTCILLFNSTIAQSN